MPKSCRNFRYWGPSFHLPASSPSLDPEMLSAPRSSVVYLPIWPNHLGWIALWLTTIKYNRPRWRQTDAHLSACADNADTRTRTHTPCGVRARLDARRSPSKAADCWQRVRTDRRAAKRSWNFPPGRLVNPVLLHKNVCVWALIHTRRFPLYHPRWHKTSLQFVARIIARADVHPSQTGSRLCSRSPPPPTNISCGSTWLVPSLPVMTQSEVFLSGSLLQEAGGGDHISSCGLQL